LFEKRLSTTGRIKNRRPPNFLTELPILCQRDPGEEPGVAYRRTQQACPEESRVVGSKCPGHHWAPHSCRRTRRRTRSSCPRQSTAMGAHWGSCWRGTRPRGIPCNLLYLHYPFRHRRRRHSFGSARRPYPRPPQTRIPVARMVQTVATTTAAATGRRQDPKTVRIRFGCARPPRVLQVPVLTEERQPICKNENVSHVRDQSKRCPVCFPSPCILAPVFCDYATKLE